MQKLSVILVTHKRIEMIGGIERMIELLYDRLTKFGIHAYIVCRQLFKIVRVLRPEEREQLRKVDRQDIASGIEVRTFRPPEFIGVIAELLFSFVAMLRIISIIKNCRKKGNMVIVHGMDTVYGGLAAFLASKLLNVPYIVHTHGVRAYFMLTVSRNIIIRTIDFLVEKMVIKNANMLLSVNNEARNFWIKNGILGEKIIVIPVFINMKHFFPNPISKKWERSRYGIDENTLVFGYIGRLSPEKNVSSLIRAFSMAKLDRAKLLIIGDGPLFSILKQYAQSEGIADKVVFTGFRNDIHRIINAIDVLVLPSLIEGLPTVILEAYSNGKPVIASNITSIREVVQNEGILFDPYDTNQLKNALIELYQNNILRIKMAENAKRKAKQYDVHTGLEKIIKLYNDIFKKFGW